MLLTAAGIVRWDVMEDSQIERLFSYGLACMTAPLVERASRSYVKQVYVEWFFAGMRGVFGTLAPQLRHAKVHFCATSTHEMHPPWFREFFACSELLAYAIRNALFLKLSSLALSAVFPSPPEPVRNGPGKNVTFLTGRLGAILGHLGGDFCATSTRFSHFSEEAAR